MPLVEIKIAPGMFSVQTDREGRNRWKSGDKVRFHNGMPQKLGGWLKYSANTFTGICRMLFDWASLALVRYKALGCVSKFYVETAGTFSDITPAGLAAGVTDSTDGGAQCSVWTADNWGEDLIINRRGGAIYLWDTSVGVGTAAAAIAGTPTSANGLFVSPLGQHLVLLGAHNGTYLDPMLIRWSDSQDYTYWTAGTGHTTGAKHLSTGNQIMCGVKTLSGEYAIFTDSHLWSMTYEGQDNLTFDFHVRGENRGIQGPNAAIEADGKIYWMGARDFMMYDGTIQVLPCDVHNLVFGNVKTPLINTVQGFKVTGHFNKQFREIWWDYPANGQNENTNYVIYNIDEKWWSWGTRVRTAAVGDSKIFDYVYAAGADGFLYKHDSGTEDGTIAMVPTLESYDIELPGNNSMPGEGEFLMFCGRAIPDFKLLTGTVNLSLKVRKYPQGSQITKGPYAITSSTDNLNPRARGRQMAIALTSSAIGDDWRYGGIRLELQPDGQK
jgi:hypothetical protein